MNIHTVFSDWSGDSREHRLVHFSVDTPRERRGDDMRGERERMREKVPEVKKLLRLAAEQEGDKDTLAILDDPAREQMVVAFVEYLRGTMRMLPPATKENLARYQPQLRALKEKWEEFQRGATKEAARSSADVGAAAKDIREAGTAGIPLPEKANVRAVVETQMTQPQLLARYQAILAIAQAIAGGDEAGVRQRIDAAMGDIVDFMGSHVKDSKALNDEVARFQAFLRELVACKATPDKTLLQAMEEKILAYVSLLNGKQRETLEGALLKTAEQRAENKAAQDQWFNEHFRESIRYNWRVGGTNAQSFIFAALQEDGKFNPETLETALKGFALQDIPYDASAVKTAAALASPELGDTAGIISQLEADYGVKYSEAYIKRLLSVVLDKGNGDAGLNVAIDHIKKIKPALTDEAIRKSLTAILLRAWAPATLELYLRNTYPFVENPSGISLPKLSLRARLPREVADELSAAGLDVSVGTFLDVAQIATLPAEGDKLDTEATRMILAKVMEDEGGKKVLKEAGKRKLVEILSLLLYTSDGRKRGMTALQLKQDAEKICDDLLRNPGLFKQMGNAWYLQAGKEDAVSAALAPAVTVGWIGGQKDALRASGTGNLAWEQVAQMKVREALRTGESALGLWWEYVKKLPATVINKPEDEKLRTLLRGQKALDAYAGGIRRVLDADDSGRKHFRGVLDKARDGWKQEEDLRKDLSLLPVNQKTLVLQAGALNRAAVAAMREMDAEFGWKNLPLLQQQYSLWLALHKGPDAARRFLQAAVQNGGDPVMFVWTSAARMLTPAEQTAFRSYLSRVNQQETLSGRDRMAELAQRGIFLKPLPLEILAHRAQAADVDRWLLVTDRTQAGAGLASILEGPGTAAFIDAFVNRRETSYAYNGVREIITPADATVGVEQIQAELRHKAMQTAVERKNLKNDVFAENPVEKGLRAGVDTLKELWAGDWIGKGTVVSAVVLGLWALRQMWRNGWTKDGKWWEKLGIRGIAGFTIATVANAIYRRQTGRDFLGEVTRFVPKEERQTGLERFRREAAKNDRYRFLLQQSGQAALRELMSERDPVPVSTLLLWRRKVKGNGYLDYTLGAPPNLQVGGILGGMWQGAERKDGLQRAYWAFESLCVQVADLRKLGGSSLDEKAELGAEWIASRYVRQLPFDPRNAKPGVFPAGGKVTMFEVMNSEMHSPATQEDIIGNRTFVEWLGDATGLGYAKVLSLLRRNVAVAQIWARRGKEAAGEYWEAGKEWAMDKITDVKEWAEVTYPKLRREIGTSLSSAGNLILGTGNAVRLYVKETAPGVVTWVCETGVGAADKAVDIARNTLRTLRTNGVTGPVLTGLESLIVDLWNAGVEKEWKTEEYLKEKLASVGAFKKDLLEQVAKIATPLPEDTLDTWIKSVLGKDVAALTREETDKKVDAVERMRGYELVKKRVFASLVASRIRWVLAHRGDADFAAVKTPLAVDWTTLPDPSQDQLYAYLLAHYDPAAILGLMGNQRTSVGLLEAIKQYYPQGSGRFAEVLLYPGILQAISYESAEDYLLPQVQAYFKPILTKAKETLGEQSLAYRNVRQYVDTVTMNVLMESVLSGKEPKDLLLTTGQAKHMYHELFRLRGLASSQVAAQADALKPFGIQPDGDIPPQPVTPPELQAVLDDGKARLVLMGVEPPPVVASVAGPAAPGVPAGPTPTPTAGPSAMPDPVRIRQLVAQPVRPHIVEELAKGITADQERDLRQAALNLTKPVPTLTGNLADNIQYLLSIPADNAKQYAEEYLNLLVDNVDTAQTLVQRAKLLHESFGTARQNQLNSSPRHAERLQHVLNEGVTRMLRLILDEMKKVPDVDTLRTDSRRSAWEAALLELYACTDPATDKITDQVSTLLEYVLYLGNHKEAVNGKSKDEKYKEYLAGKGLALTAEATKRMQIPTSRSIPVSYLKDMPERQQRALENEIKSVPWK